MRASWPGATARRLGLSGVVDFTPARVGITLHIPCARGEHIVDVEVPARLHPDGVAKEMLKKGWTIGRRLTCPDCQPKRMKRKGDTMAVATAEPKQPTPAAGRARRLVYMALEDYYDEAAKRYKPGHSDASIARDCGIAENVVKTIREESYGPLAEPSELAAFREELGQMGKEITAMAAAARQSIQALETRLSLIARRGGWE